MKKIKALFQRLIPGYAHPPIMLCLLGGVIAFWGSRIFIDTSRYVNLSLPIDDMIPLVPEASLIYLLWYVYILVNLLLVMRESREKCGVLFAECFAKLICMAFFIAMPTYIERPELTGDGIWVGLLRGIYASDIPNNLFPSIHCLDSWFCWRGLCGAKKVGRGYKAFSLVLTLAIFASTVLVKQHYFVDMFGAVFVAEIALLFVNRLRLGERYAAWCDRHDLPALPRKSV